MIVGIYKMHSKKIDVKNQVHYFYENIIKPKKIDTRNVFIDDKS